MKKAFAWLEARGIAYEFHDYKRDGASADELRKWARQAGWQALANTRGPTWRKIPEREKQDLDEARTIALLVKNPSAIRRPIVEAGSTLLVGFDPDRFAKTLE
jgi:Spx/MgsR family transcriptional regulator